MERGVRHRLDSFLTPCSELHALNFYRFLPDEIEVVRVIHGARDLKSIFGEGEL